MCCRMNRVCGCGSRPHPVPMNNGCGIPMPLPMSMNGCNPPVHAPAIGRVTNCPEVVQTVIEPTITCPTDIYNHFTRVEHIVPVQRTTMHMHHNQHDFIIQEQTTIDNVTERHMGPTQMITNTVQGPNVDMGWVNSYNQTPMTPLQAAGMGPVVNNVGFNQFALNNQAPFVGNGIDLIPNQFGNSGIIPGLTGIPGIR